MRLRHRTRPLMMICTGVTTAAFLTACSSGSGSSAAGAQSSTLQEVIKRGTLNVASCLTFPPFGSKDKNNKPQGFDVDVATAMATALGVKVKIVDTTSANRIPNLQTKKVDAVV